MWHWPVSNNAVGCSSGADAAIDLFAAVYILVFTYLPTDLKLIILTQQICTMSELLLSHCSRTPSPRKYHPGHMPWDICPLPPERLLSLFIVLLYFKLTCRIASAVTRDSTLLMIIYRHLWNLRPRTHSRQLPDHSGHLTNSNFFTRLLSNDIY